MTTKTPAKRLMRRWLLGFVAIALPSLAIAVSSCTGGDDLAAPSDSAGVGGAGGAKGGSCVDKHEGCACTTEGERIDCGKVIQKLGNQTVCGKGYSVCSQGKWGACFIDNAPGITAIVLDPGTNIKDLPLSGSGKIAAPVGPVADVPGLHAEGLGSPTMPCTSNPCDPYCVDYPDTPNGLTDAGTNVQPGDGGLMTVPDSGSLACTPKTCVTAGNKNCGPVSDTCGGVLNCGTCTAPQVCGGAGVPSVCGVVPPAACTPKTCAMLGKNCGPVSDGCGGVLSCGTCTAPQTCGGAMVPSVCATPVPPGGPCVPKTCATAGKNCGPVSDTCGGVLACGNCTAPQACGGGGTPSVCGGTTCTPKTCQQLGKNCGPVADGCGALLNCGVCQSGSCGGGGTPSVCGVSGTCTGLCTNQIICAGNATTSISGKVYAPNGVDPLPNAIVYVPNGTVTAFSAGVSCDNCVNASGSPLVSTTTAVDGSFTITNMPATTNVPLVIQIGRWRRQFIVPAVAPCVNTQVNTTLQVCTATSGGLCSGYSACAAGDIAQQSCVRFPKTKLEGDIPKLAISTGQVDAMECVLRKMGIADSEFSNPGGGGRVNLYAGAWEPGAWIGNNCSGGGPWVNNCDSGNNCYSSPSCWNGHWGGGAPGSTPYEEALVSTVAALSQYDMVLFPCQGAQFYYPSGKQAIWQNNVAAYANAGGRVFATHYSDMWVTTALGLYNSSLSGAASWNLNQGFPVDQVANINVGFAKGALLANWLKLPLFAIPNPLGQIAVNTIRHDFNNVNAPTTNWLSITNPNAQIHFTFETPIGSAPANQCGKVVYSDFHVEDPSLSGISAQKVFPTECNFTAMTPQEHLLEFMLFDLASCVGLPPPPPACVPITCAAQSITCGQAGDGCGGTLTCGAACPTSSCTPITCATQGLTCGQAGDGCGGTLNCGTCVAPQTCGGGGTPGQCGSPPACVPAGCPNPGTFCGLTGDGCGAQISCGCTAPKTCGGGGQLGVCGTQPACVPTTCAAQGLSCGQAGDGCGGTLSCGTCASPDTCGGGGMPGVCGHVTTWTDGYFVRDYNATCPLGTVPYWQLWSWTSLTPGDSFIDFKVQTALTAAGLTAAPSDPLLFSAPSGPLALIGQATKAHAAGQPAGSPNTQDGSATVDNTLKLAGRNQHLPFLRVTSHLAPTTSKLSGPTLVGWDMQVDCIPTE